MIQSTFFLKVTKTNPMKNKLLFSVLSLFFLMVSCEEETEVDVEWPTSISGCNINVHVEVANGASVASNQTIRYTFSAPNEQVTGRNPESGNNYTADSYGYGKDGKFAVVTLNYGEVAYERYTFRATTETTGTYESESYNGYDSASSSGSYDLSCF